jgi:undecaprenyl-diphosphatase
LKSTSKESLFVSGAAFVALSAGAGAGLTYRTDLVLVRAAQERASGLLDGVGAFFSTAGGWEISTVVLILIVAAMYLQGHRRVATRLLAAFVAAGMIEVALKTYLPVPPIPEELGRSEDFTPTIELEYSYPYPSGHVLRSVVILGALYLWSGSRVLGAMFALCVVGMCLTRFYLGVHWPSDVLGGLLLGTAALSWAFLGKKGRA